MYQYRQSAGNQNADHESLVKYLRIRHRKHYKKRGQALKRQLIPNRVSIEQRPPIVETNMEVGHWEADTVIGKGHDGALLTLVERRTKYVLIVKLASKQARALATAAIKALRRSGLPVKTARAAPHYL
nr:IS30 family transposase [Spirosoma spitsbergense]